MIDFVVIDYKNNCSFNMKLQGLEFKFEENGAFSHPFFCKDERMRRVAQIILKDDSELIIAPSPRMTFEKGQIEVIMLD